MRSLENGCLIFFLGATIHTPSSQKHPISIPYKPLYSLTTHPVRRVDLEFPLFLCSSIYALFSGFFKEGKEMISKKTNKMYF